MLADILCTQEGKTGCQVYKLAISLSEETPHLKVLPAFLTPNDECIISDLNTQFVLKELELPMGKIWYEGVSVDDSLVILVLDKIQNISGILPLSSFENVTITKIMITVLLKLLKQLLFDLEQVYKETKSKDIGEQYNKLLKLYDKYKRGGF